MHKQIQLTVEVGGGSKPRTKDVIWQEHRIRLYTIGWLRYMTYLADVTLRGWERKGILPKPFFKLGGNTRWYTPAELMAYSARIQQHYSSDRDLGKLKKDLIDLSMRLRKQYMGLKPTDKLTLGMAELQGEKQMQENFGRENTKRKLSKEHFHEVQSLIKGNN
jgi:hypothetical protein